MGSFSIFFSRESDSTTPNVLQWCGYIKTWVRLYSKWCGYITHGAVIFKMVWLYSAKPLSALTLICHHQHPPHHFYTILITFLTTYHHPTTIVTNIPPHYNRHHHSHHLPSRHTLHITSWTSALTHHHPHHNP